MPCCNNIKKKNLHSKRSGKMFVAWSEKKKPKMKCPLYKFVH